MPLKEQLNLLQGIAPRLHKESPNNRQPDTIQPQEENVIMIPNLRERNGIDIHIRDKRHLTDEILNSKAAGPHVEGHHFSGVGVEERVASDVVHDVEEEEADYYTVAGALFEGLGVNGGEGDEGDEDCDHANVR